MSLMLSILKQAALHPKRVAIVDDKREYTYGQIMGGAFYMAEHISHATSANHIGLMLPTSGAFPIALLGCWLARRVPVPLNYLLSKDELAYLIDDSDVDTVYTAQPMLEYLGGRENLPDNVRFNRMEDVQFNGLPEPRWPPYFSRDEVAVLLYTSATTGKPKGVMLTHGNLQSNVKASIEHAQLTSMDTFLGVLPQFHSFGLTVLTLLPLTIGSKVVYTARFQPRKVVELIREHDANAYIGVPSMFSAMLNIKEAAPEDFQRLRILVSGGEPLPTAVYEAFEDRFGVKLLEGYGLTETAPVATWCTPSANRRYSVGRALPGVDVMILDEHDQPLPPNEEGEIVVAGANVMKGYYKLPDLTNEAMVDVIPRGSSKPVTAFRTGDIGHVDPEGYLYITGRKKEMLIISGENVFPREIEEIIDQHPDVTAAAVIGKQDGMRGEVPIAFIEVVENSNPDPEKIRQFCRDRLASYKIPKEVHIVDELPRAPTGKVLRRMLQQPVEQVVPT